jgi:hypothetical protein
MNVTDFLRHKRISVKIMTLLRSSWCSNCYYTVVILSTSISNPCQNIRVKIESNSRNACRRLYTAEHQATILFACISWAIQAILQQGRPCTYCLQYCIILSCLIVKQELNNYTACLWFLKELSEKKQAKVVRQAEIKTSVSDMFCLNALKTAKQMCEKERVWMCIIITLAWKLCRS